MRKFLKRSGNLIISGLAWQLRAVFLIGAIIVGLSAAALALLSEKAEFLFRQLQSDSWVFPMLLPVVGMVVIAWLTSRFFKGSEGSGIPQTIVTLQRKEQNFLRKNLLSLRVSIGKLFLTVLGLFCGLSIGREGPTVQIGASIMYFLGRVARFPPHFMEKGLILAGGAGGIAAAFNTPLAGIVFAIEELSRSFEERTSGIIMTTVVIAGLTAISIQGNYIYFGSSYADLPSGSSWLAIPVCGLFGGLLGGLFSQMLISGSQILKPWFKSHPVQTVFCCGLVVSLMGFLSDGTTFGTGYQQAAHILDGTSAYDPWFPFYKFFATVASYLGGVPGGIFSPSLSAGAGFSAVFHHWFPVAPYETMILLGMVAYFSGVIQSPITAFVIMMEMTNNHDILIALMITSIIAYGASRIVCPVPVYRALALQFIESQKRFARPVQEETTEPDSESITEINQASEAQTENEQDKKNDQELV